MPENRWDLAELRATEHGDDCFCRCRAAGFIDGMLSAEEEHADRDYARLLRALDRRTRARMAAIRVLGWGTLAVAGAALWWVGR